MRVLLLSGLGPIFKNSQYFKDSLFDADAAERLSSDYFLLDGRPFDLGSLVYVAGGSRERLLRRRRESIPHLTTFTLESILDESGFEYERLPIAPILAGQGQPPSGDVDVVFISTTFIWEKRSLKRLVDWVSQTCPEAVLVLGGQYSNLKYPEILANLGAVHAIVRGDGEIAAPTLLNALEGRKDLASIPNLAYRDERGDLRVNQLESVDIETFRSPSFAGYCPTVPYESMRSCPFTCKYCSYPFASPEWRYKSAKKIFDDWRGYVDDNGATFIKAMDSTFTVPPTRLRELFGLLPSLSVEWEAYSRANSISSTEIVDRLVESHCRTLSIGFESMSEKTLKLMDKRVRAHQNRRAFDLLVDSDVGYRCSFMAGYPGETPEDFEETRKFLVEEFAGHYMLSVFSLSDETMPVWKDADRLKIEILDEEQPDLSWRHIGMDVQTARDLQRTTLDDVRRKSESAVLLLWQADYVHPLLPHLDRRSNWRVEKLIERLALLPRDFVHPSDGHGELERILHEMEGFGVFPDWRLLDAAPARDPDVALALAD